MDQLPDQQKHSTSLPKILAILIVVIILVLVGWYFWTAKVEAKQLTAATQTLNDKVALVKNKSIEDMNNIKWGLHFVDASPDYYQIFSTPSNYQDSAKTVTETIYLPSKVSFTVSSDVLFENSGYPASAVMVTLRTSTKSTTIDLSAAGDVKSNSVATGAPAQVTGLKLSAADGSVSLQWSAPSNNGSPITTYKIYRGISSETETFLKNVGSTAFADSGLTNGITYYYKVSAKSSAGEGLLSAESSATPFSGKVPGAPLNLNASIGCTKGVLTVSLIWDVPSAAEGAITNYKLYRDDALLGEAATRYFVDQKASFNKKYIYQVSAVNAAGEGSKSERVTTTTLKSGICK